MTGGENRRQSKRCLRSTVLMILQPLFIYTRKYLEQFFPVIEMVQVQTNSWELRLNQSCNLFLGCRIGIHD